MSDDAAVWRALADPTRRQLLDQLGAGPRTTGQLAEAVPALTRFAVMKHLTVLQDAGLVAVERSGRERWNHLNAVPLRAAYQRWMAPFAERSAESLLSLKDHVEKGRTMNVEVDITQEVVVEAPRERVFEALCEMGQWFPHRFIPGAPAVLEPRLGGRFYEGDGENLGVLYATVTRIERPARLTLTGPMGMTGPVAGVISYELEETGSSTTLRLSHKALGDVSEETQQAYTKGWVQVHDALQKYVRGTG